MTAVALQELSPAVLFPANGPAGLDLDAIARQAGLRPFVSNNEQQKAEHAAQVHIRKTAADLFVENFAAGLTPSEATDVVLQDETYVAARAALLSHKARRERPRQIEIAKKIFPIQLWALSPPLGKKLESGTRFRNAVGTALERLAAHPTAGRIPTSIPDEQRKADPLWFLSDRVLPDEFVRGMLASSRAYALSATLDGLIHERRTAAGRNWNLPLIDAAARIWSEEVWRYLTLLASIPELHVPASQIPMHDRFDLVAAVERQKSMLTALNAA